MQTSTHTHTPGPMEIAVRDLAYIGEADGLLQAAQKADRDRAALLDALRALSEWADGITYGQVTEEPCLGQARAAIEAATGTSEQR